MKTQKVWTFRISHGSEFRLTFPGNPPCEHGKGTTIWKMVGEESHCAKVRKALEEAVGEGHVEVFTEEMTPEQRALRVQRLTKPEE